MSILIEPLVKQRPILFVINRLAVGGAEKVLLEDIEEFTKKGREVFLITLRPERSASLMSQCTLPHERRVLIPFRSLYDLRAWLSFVRTVRLHKPCALVSHLWFANTIARIGGTYAGVQCIVTFEHNIYDAVKRKWAFSIDRILQRYSSRIVAVSEGVKKSLTRHGIGEDRISVIPNGVNISRFGTNATTEEVRSELGIPASEPLFLNIGRLTEQKGQDALLRAFAKISGHLAIVGEGEKRGNLEGLARELHLLDRVHFLGVRHDIERLMQAADCFVFPSRWEGMSVVMLEALAAGLPIVATDFPSVRELVSDGENGYVVAIDDAAALADRMRFAVEDPERREKLGNTSRQRAQKFSSSAHAAALLAEIESTGR